ncbi:MAG: hypothetical protein N4A33_13095 [Bacteriovoracaceae bacterium]|nr:hypothetical protein [Bacteriovoracaceae bacterium]
MSQSLQTKIIEKYKLIYPNDTIKDISQKTGIQFTRVFRILNFAPMKLSEYEAFNHAIEKELATNEVQFINLASKIYQNASPSKVNTIFKELSQLLKICLFDDNNSHRSEVKACSI